MTKFLQLLISGISTGSIYGLIALGFVLVYKATRVFNFAQGDLMMLGAYMIVTYGVIWNLDLWAALPLTILSGAAVGILFQLIFVRPLIGRDFLAVVMATIGASLVIQATVQIAWGTADQPYPTDLPHKVYTVGDIHVSSLDLIAIGISAVCLAVFAFFFRATDIGLQMRAAAEHNEAAVLSGINIRRVSLIAWSTGTVLAFVGGFVLANTTGVVNVTLAGLGLLAFPAVVIGGLESIPGAVIGGVIVGVLEVMVGGYIDVRAQQAMVYVALLVVLLVRPYGLFGQRDIVRV
jgi:branched-chain amino acid transport system permease protein